MRGIGMGVLVEGSDAHRALALSVDLGQPMAEHGMRAVQIREIHRPAAIDDGLEAGMVGGRRRRMLGQALDHGRRAEQRHAAMQPKQLEDLGRIEAAARRDHLAGGFGRVRQDIAAPSRGTSAPRAGWRRRARSGRRPRSSDSVIANRLRWLSIAPFGWPVVPLV